MWSLELRAMLRPERTYTSLAGQLEPERLWLLARRPLQWFLVIGSFVSLTTSGRLLASHLLLSVLAWSFSPLLQILWMRVVLRLFRRELPLARSVDLFFVGQGPWLCFLWLIAAAALFTPEGWTTLGALLGSGFVPLGVLAAVGWSMLLTLACFRRGFELGSRRGFYATLCYYGLYGSTLVGYYWVVGQLPPIIGVGTA